MSSKTLCASPPSLTHLTSVVCTCFLPCPQHFSCSASLRAPCSQHRAELLAPPLKLCPAGASACRGVFLFLWDPTALHLPSTGHRKPVMTYCSNSENDMEIKRWHRNSCWLCRDWKTAPRNRVQTVSFYFYTQKSIPNFQRYFVSGLLFSFHNSQCSPRSLNVIMQRGRTGTISPLKPLYWHTCKTKINCSLLPTLLMPASVCNFLLLFLFTFSSLGENHFIFHTLLAAGILQMREAGLRCSYPIPQQKSLQTYGAVTTLSFRWRGKQASGLGSFVMLRLLD